MIGLKKRLKPTKRNLDYLKSLPKIYIVIRWANYAVMERPFADYKKDKRTKKLVPFIYDLTGHNSFEEEYVLTPYHLVTPGSVVCYAFSRPIAELLAKGLNTLEINGKKESAKERTENIQQALIDKELSTKPFSMEPYAGQFDVEDLLKNYKTQEFLINYYDNENSMIRLTQCNWTEIHSVNTWGMTQDQLNNISFDTIMSIITKNSLEKRLYGAVVEDYLYLYYYGRDYRYEDYWWILKKKQKEIKDI